MSFLEHLDELRKRIVYAVVSILIGFLIAFGFIQQIFDRSQYQSLTGLLEIQGQAAMMIAGGLGGILVEHVSLTTILLFDAATYLVSFQIGRAHV